VNPRRLYRSRSERVLTGIAGGIAEYLEVDPTVVRILWVLAAIFSGGLAVLLYIVLAFVIQPNPYQTRRSPSGGGYPAPTQGGGWAQPGTSWGQPAPEPGPAPTTSPGGPPAEYASTAAPTWSPDWAAQWETPPSPRVERPGRAGLIIGTVLIVFGVIALVDLVVPGWISGALLGPALLLALGGAVLVASVRRDGSPVEPPAAAAGRATTVVDTRPEVHPDPALDVDIAPAPPAAPAAGFGTGSDVYDSDVTTTAPTHKESDPT